MQWYADVGPVPQHIAGLLHLGPTTVTAEQLADVLANRLAQVPSLHRYPVDAPVGAGGPYWLSDDGPVRDHIRIERGVGSTDAMLLARATTLMVRRLARRRALWAAHVLTDTDDTTVAVLVVLHHVLADGITGARLLAALADPGDRHESAGHDTATLSSAPPRTAPSRRTLARQAWTTRARGLRRMPSALGSLRPALRELGIGHGSSAPASSLNRATGPRRRHVAVTLPEAPLRAGARRAGGSLNDALLAAVADVLAQQARRAGEDVATVVVSVPVAVRLPVDIGRGQPETNAVGVMPTPVPTGGSLDERIAFVARWRHARLDRMGAGASLPLVLGVFRLVHALHLVRWYSYHQRLVTTFATAIPGPTAPMSVAGIPIARITPLVMNQGNTTIAFASMTYAGRLTISVVADPEHGPDPTDVARGLQEELGRLLPPNSPKPTDVDRACPRHRLGS